MSDQDKFAIIATMQCIACAGDTGGMVGQWSPTDECLRGEFGVDPPRQGLSWLYPVCPICAARCGLDSAFGDRVEGLIIGRFRRAVGRTMAIRESGRPRI
jgi:hypothetical protein